MTESHCFPGCRLHHQRLMAPADRATEDVWRHEVCWWRPTLSEADRPSGFVEILDVIGLVMAAAAFPAYDSGGRRMTFNSH